MTKFHLSDFRTERRPIHSDQVVIKLPRPPSLNHAQQSGKNGHRYNTKAYENWKDAAGKCLNAQKPKRFTQRVDIAILIEQTARVSDIDNRIKPVCDLLQAHQIIPNDNQEFVRGVSCHWSTEIEGAQVTITPVGRAA